MPRLATEAGGYIRCKYCGSRKWVLLAQLLCETAPTTYCSPECRLANTLCEIQRRERGVPTECVACGETVTGVHTVAGRVRDGRIVGGFRICRCCRQILLRACASKKRFETETAAREMLLDLTTAPRPVDLDVANAYECPICLGFHVASHGLGDAADQWKQRSELIVSRIKAGVFGWDPMDGHRLAIDESEEIL